ncbi:MAG TPA: YlxR family protein [Phycicoccus sp.]|nr:YlxR family protein [Phycicoccus sp.]
MVGADRTGTRPGQSVTPAASPSGPTRTCIGCRGTDSWSVLLRVVAGPAAGPDVIPGVVPVIPDPRRRLGGRGAWLHPTIECCDQAIRRRAFGRALRVSAPTDPAAVTAYVIEHAQNHVRPQGTESGFDADEHPMSTQQ